MIPDPQKHLPIHFPRSCRRCNSIHYNRGLVVSAEIKSTLVKAEIAATKRLEELNSVVTMLRWARWGNEDTGFLESLAHEAEGAFENARERARALGSTNFG